MGTSDAKKKVSTSAKEIYKKTDVIARAHGQVMDPYQLADDRKGGCGRPSERSVKRANYLINTQIRRKQTSHEHVSFQLLSPLHSIGRIEAIQASTLSITF